MVAWGAAIALAGRRRLAVAGGRAAGDRRRGRQRQRGLPLIDQPDRHARRDARADVVGLLAGGDERPAAGRRRVGHGRGARRARASRSPRAAWPASPASPSSSPPSRRSRASTPRRSWPRSAAPRPHRHPPGEGRWAMIFRQITHDDLGCASYLWATTTRRRRGRRSAAGHRRVPAPGALPRRAHRARARDPQPRRPRLRPRPPGRLDRRDHPHPPRGGARLRPRALRRRLGARARLARGARRCTPPATGPSTPPSRSSTPSAAPSRGRCSPATRSSSAASRGPTSPSTRARARTASSTRCTSGLLTLPDTCEVWPGHLGGSMCGGPGIDLKVSSTIGYERAHQEVLGVVDEEEFVERAVAGLGPQPPNFRAIVAINTGPLTRGAAQFDPLTPRQVEQHQRDGALRRRRPHRAAVRRRAHPRRDLHHRAARRLRLAAGVARRPRPARGRRRPRRRRRAAARSGWRARSASPTSRATSPAG